MSEKTDGKVRILHILARFPDGAVAQQCIEAISGLGADFEHEFAVVQGQSCSLPPMGEGVSARLRRDFPTLGGRPTPGRLVPLARAMAGYDLVLTYGWGAMNAVLAHRVFGASFALPPLIHHEMLLEDDEAAEFTARRNWLRRLALATAHRVIVGGQPLADAAASRWHVPRGRIAVISRAIDPDAYGAPAPNDALPGLIKRKGEMWVGTRLDGQAPDGAAHLIDAVAKLPDQWQLVITGDLASPELVRAMAAERDMSHRVHLAGRLGDVPAAYALFDLYADIGGPFSDPLGAVRAMASGKAILADRGSAAAALLSTPNREVLNRAADEASLEALSDDPALCAEIGAANRALAAKRLGQRAMFERYREIYLGASRRAE